MQVNTRIQKTTCACFLVKGFLNNMEVYKETKMKIYKKIIVPAKPVKDEWIIEKQTTNCRNETLKVLNVNRI